MHIDEVDTDAALVHRLLVLQFPQWAALPIARVDSSGTDNAIYRLGDELAVRLPRRAGAAGQVEKEARWLPVLAPHLPLSVPLPLAMGEPGEGYPWRWAVVPWMAGRNATAESLTNLQQAAADLAEFVSALQRIDTAGGPRPDAHNFGRGAPLVTRDERTRACIRELRGLVDTDAVTELWESALAAPLWDCPPVWVHGDLTSGNLLQVDGRLSAVIDFGALGVGDPAVELIVAWNLFSGDSRATFRAALEVDDAMWERGRGWALSVALIALPYYMETNPAIVESSLRVVAEVLSERGV